MSKYMTHINAAELLNAWLKAGLVAEKESIALQDFILAQQQEKELALYLRILIGISAFIASLSFIGFLAVAEIIDFDSEIEMIIEGLVFIGSALFLATKSAHNQHTVQHSFLLQTSFCAMGIGKILFVIGCNTMFGGGDSWNLTFSTGLITLLTYPIYRMSIDRFLSVLTFLILVLISMIDHPVDAMEIMLNLFFLVQIVLGGWLLTNGKVKRDYIPLAYAITVSLCIMVIYFSMGASSGWNEERSYNLTFINAVLMLSLVSLIAWAAGSLEKLKTAPLNLAALAALLLAFISAPGVLLSICLMVLGYAKHEKLLLLLGILLMPAFIFMYYYNLDLSLMVKSGILISSGIVLLAGRAYLALKQLDQEV